MAGLRGGRLAARTIIWSTMLLLMFVFDAYAQAKDPQLKPLRLASTGDSMSVGGDAEYYGPNPNASWVNGYYGFWEWLRGLTNVNSHNQRITANWGKTGRRNFINAFGGARMRDFAPQAARAAWQKAQYVTVLLGQSDVCRDYQWEIPTDEEFEAQFRAGMENLRKGLPNGATVYVLSIVDIRRLYDVAKDKRILDRVDCQTAWADDRFPCSTMLDPANTDADREYVRSRNIAFNDILERVTAEYQAGDPHHHYYFTHQPFAYAFTESDVSDLDCFHPSAQGQATISRESWNAGPFRAYQAGN